MNRILLSIAFIFVGHSILFAQLPKMPLHFETDYAYQFINFSGGVASVTNNPVPGGINTSPKVCRIVKNPGQVWGGVVIDVDSALEFNTKKIMRLKVWSPRAGVPIKYKVENATDDTKFYEIDDTITVANAWTIKTFDFSAIDINNEYSRIVIIFDFGVMGDGSANFTWYVDDIVLETPTQPAVLKTAVKFRVNMKNEITLGRFNKNTDYVVLAGADYWPNCGPVLVDPTGIDIYEYTDSLWVGQKRRYRFFHYKKPGGVPPGVTPCQFTEGTYEPSGFTLFCPTAADGERVFTAPFTSGSVNIPTVCFGQCYGCPTINPNDSTSIIFTVNMRDYSLPFNNAYVSGSFNNWLGTQYPMEHIGNDFYQVKVVLPPTADTVLEYKFHVDSWADQEDLSVLLPCVTGLPGSVNRFAIINGDTTMPAFCWNTCNACYGTPPPAKKITFRVDLSRIAGEFNQPFFSSDLNGWCGTCEPLTDENNDNIWEITKLIATNDIQYKFTYDNYKGQEYLLSGKACTFTNAGEVNRYLEITQDRVLPVICWQSCDNCSIPADSVNVTFKVDISKSGIYFNENVYVNGSFNKWCGECNAMTELNKTAIFEYKTKAALGPMQFLFTMDGYRHIEQINPNAECVVYDGTNANRKTIITQNTTLGTLCWGSCDECFGNPVGENDLFENQTLSIYPNPNASSVLFLSKITSGNIFSAEGRLITSFQNKNEIDISYIAKGYYFLISDDNQKLPLIVF